ncbi:MAG: sensor domain-containing diguanylate cyclase, partial [Thiolinea sp.]
MRERAKTTVSEIARSEARSLNQKLQEVSRNAEYLQTLTTDIFSQIKSGNGNHDLIKLERTDNGIAYRDLNTIMDGSTIYGSSLPSSIYVPADTDLNDSLKHRLQMTEQLDLHFQRTVDSNPTIHSVYFNTWDNASRLYPPLENVPDIYGANVQTKLPDFAHLSDPKQNPNRETRWTGAYLDQTGFDWMLSSITPISNKGFIEGVVGIDITLRDFTANLLSTSLIWDSIPMVVQDNGDVLGISREGQLLLNVSLPAGHTKLTSEAKLPEEHNLFRRSYFSAPDLGDFVKGSTLSSCCIWLDGAEYLVSQQIIAETGWRLIVITPMSKVTQQVTEYQRFLKNMGIYFLLLTLVFFALFFVYLKMQAKLLAERVSNPVELVTNYISRLNKIGNNKPLPAMQVGIRELDRLINSGTEIQLARSRLGQLNEELEEKNNQLRTLATTDRLTGLYNRHKLDEMLSYELNKAQRDGSHLSLALLDIDHFKRVNDTYGHQVGDDVLVSVAALMQKHVRCTDIVGRWGGEEFMVLLPNTPMEQAATVLNQMREQIAGSNFDPVPSVTISLGLARSHTHHTPECIAAAADKALYRAKSNGRNRLEMEHEQEEEYEIAGAF